MKSGRKSSAKKSSNVNAKNSEGALIQIDEKNNIIPPIIYADFKKNDESKAGTGVVVGSRTDKVTLEDRLKSMNISTSQDIHTSLKQDELFEPTLKVLEDRIRLALMNLNTITEGLTELQTECEVYLEYCRVTEGGIRSAFKREMLQQLSNKVVLTAATPMSDRKKGILPLCHLISLFNQN